MKVKDIDISKRKHLSILIYGPAGSGKTALVTQASGGYLFDFDDGMRTAKTLADKFSSKRAELEFDTYLDARPTNPVAWMTATKKIIQLSDASAAGKLLHDAVIIDSLTGMARAISLQIMAQAGMPLGKMQIQHWGMAVNEMENALTRLRALDCLLLVTAHETSYEVDDSDFIRPMSITKKHSLNKLAWLFDEVYHAKVRRASADKINYILSGRATSSIMARSRSGMSTDFNHTDMGLVGLLNKVGYSYGSNKDGKD